MAGPLVAFAVLGGEARVPTPEGEVMLKIPRHSNTGRRIRIPGKGLYEKGSKERGDLTVQLSLVLPAEIDAELEGALSAWRSRHPHGKGAHA